MFHFFKIRKSIIKISNQILVYDRISESAFHILGYMNRGTSLIANFMASTKIFGLSDKALYIIKQWNLTDFFLQNWYIFNHKSASINVINRINIRKMFSPKLYIKNATESMSRELEKNKIHNLPGLRMTSLYSWSAMAKYTNTYHIQTV